VKNRDTVVRVLCYELTDAIVGVLFPKCARVVSLLQTVRTDSLLEAASYSRSSVNSFLQGGKTAGVWSWLLNSVKFKNLWSYIPTPHTSSYGAQGQLYFNLLTECWHWVGHEYWRRKLLLKLHILSGSTFRYSFCLLRPDLATPSCKLQDILQIFS
jgi:hypothetical protein